MSLILTRLLYPEDEVVCSFITELLLQQNIDACYYWGCEIYYSDIDNMCLVPMDSIINKTDSFLSVKDRPHSTIFNSFIATKPDNPVLHECIQQIVYNVTHRV